MPGNQQFWQGQHSGNKPKGDKMQAEMGQAKKIKKDCQRLCKVSWTKIEQPLREWCRWYCKNEYCPVAKWNCDTKGPAGPEPGGPG